MSDYLGRGKWWITQRRSRQLSYLAEEFLRNDRQSNRGFRMQHLLSCARINESPQARQRREKREAQFAMKVAIQDMEWKIERIKHEIAFIKKLIRNVSTFTGGENERATNQTRTVVSHRDAPGCHSTLGQEIQQTPGVALPVLPSHSRGTTAL